MKAIGPSEHKLQVALCDYLAIGGRKDLYWAAIPNGGHRHIRQAMKLKAEGVRRGSPDMFFLLPDGRTGWLELKTKKGSLSPEQREFRDKAQALGHQWAVVNNIDDAIHLLSAWGVFRSAYARTEAFREAAKMHLTLARVVGL